MIRFVRAWWHRVKGVPFRSFYAGYEQGVRDGLARREHAVKWLATRDGVKRQAYPNE